VVSRRTTATVVPELKLPGLRRHFRLGGETSTDGQKTSSFLTAAVLLLIA
jgi:hypothetical protein